MFFVVVEALHDFGAVSGDGRGEQDDVGAFLYCVVVDYRPLAGDAGDFQVVGIAGLQKVRAELVLSLSKGPALNPVEGPVLSQIALLRQMRSVFPRCASSLSSFSPAHQREANCSQPDHQSPTDAHGQ
jgi:hypothetical protein